MKVARQSAGIILTVQVEWQSLSWKPCGLDYQKQWWKLHTIISHASVIIVTNARSITSSTTGSEIGSVLHCCSRHTTLLIWESQRRWFHSEKKATCSFDCSSTWHAHPNLSWIHGRAGRNHGYEKHPTWVFGVCLCLCLCPFHQLHALNSIWREDPQRLLFPRRDCSFDPSPVRTPLLAPFNFIRPPPIECSPPHSHRFQCVGGKSLVNVHTRREKKPASLQLAHGRERSSNFSFHTSSCHTWSTAAPGLTISSPWQLDITRVNSCWSASQSIICEMIDDYTVMIAQLQIWTQYLILDVGSFLWRCCYSSCQRKPHEEIPIPMPSLMGHSATYSLWHASSASITCEIGKKPNGVSPPPFIFLPIKPVASRPV